MIELCPHSWQQELDTFVSAGFKPQTSERLPECHVAATISSPNKKAFNNLILICSVVDSGLK